MCYQGQLERRRDAAVIAEMAPSTFTHRMAGGGLRHNTAAFNGGRGINFAMAMGHVMVLWLAANPGQCTGFGP